MEIVSHQPGRAVAPCGIEAGSNVLKKLGRFRRSHVVEMQRLRLLWKRLYRHPCQVVVPYCATILRDWPPEGWHPFTGSHLIYLLVPCSKHATTYS